MALEFSGVRLSGFLQSLGRHFEVRLGDEHRWHIEQLAKAIRSDV